MKRIISLLLSMIIMFSITADTFAAYGGELARAYEAGDCTVTYTVQNEWDGNRQISMTVTNNGSETLRNWALKFDNAGEIADIWNASVVLNTDGMCIIKNNGYNYEIIPDGSVEFGFQLRGDELALPESVAMCNKIVDSTENAEISYVIRDNWDDGFIAEVSVTNNSDVPLEAWRLAFGGNFEISNIWNVNKLYTDEGFLVENNVATVPIASGETKSFGFQGVIASGETPELSNFVLTSIVVNLDSELPVEPDKPDAPDPENPEHIIMCFGEYIEEEKSLEVYWYSTDEGEVSLYENTDNSGWTTLTESVDGDSYKCEIGENFLVKQIKAIQETENGTLESEPFVVSHTENGIICTLIDSDNDGLADIVEEIYGTDPNNPDTDGDGLTDYEEIHLTGTNPLKYDTDENGINDAEDDIDGDGLSNKEEIALGTSVSSADTDEDGLSDYDELNIYNTDPLKADTDGDTLSDSEEIDIGLDPNDPETFGVPDAEYKVKQTIASDSETMSHVNTEEAPYELSLEISATGNAVERLSANESTYSAVTESSARLGGAVELRYLDGDVDKVKLTYKIADEYIPNENSEYTEKCLDLQGIKRYNIFRYFEEINMLLPVATEFDEESNTLYAETDELGTYCVLDMEILMRNLGIEPNDSISTEIVAQQMYSAVYSEEDNTEEEPDDKYNIIFIIDDRSTVISSEQYAAIKAQILEFAETIVAEKRDFTISVYKQSASDFIESCCIYNGCFDPKDYSYESTGKLSSNIGRLSSCYLSDDDPFGENCIISDGLDMVISLCGKDEKNYIFDIYAQENSVYDTQCSNSILELAAEGNVNISIISDSVPLTGFQNELAEATSGIVLNYNENFAGEIYRYIFDADYEKKDIPDYKYGAEFEAILATGLQKVVLNSELYPNGKNPSGEDTDTDMDGLSDWDEVNFERWERLGLITYDEKHNAELPTIQACMELVKKPYVNEGFDRFKFDYSSSMPSGMPSSAIEDSFEAKLKSIRIMPISSDPTRMDSDEDELDDIEERKIGTNPLCCDTDGDMLWDGEEHYIGTSPFNSDSDGDGLSDYEEVELWFDPLDYNPDNDFYNDYEEWKNGTNPYVYDYTPPEQALEFLKGAALGDFDEPDNIPQLLGQIAGSLIPFVADARDYFANVFKNLDTLAALLCLGGFLIDFVPAVGATGDLVKATSRAAKFVVKNVDNIPKIIDAVTKTSKFISKNDDALSMIAKAIPASTLDEIADSVKNVKRITKADFAKTLELLEAAGKNVGALKTFLSKLNPSDAQRVVDLVSKYGDDAINAFEKYGENILKAINKCSLENSKTIFALVSKLDTDTAPKFLNLVTTYGDNVIKAMTKCDEGHYKAFVYLISNSKLNRVPEVLDLVAEYGEQIIDIVKRCGIENAGIIVDGVKLCGGNATIVKKLLDVLLNHSKTMVKALAKCNNAQTVQDYIKIFEKFGNKADDLFRNGERVFGEFVGLDTALKSNAEAICFASTKAGDKCFATVSGVYTYNRTITVSDDIARELARIDKMPAATESEIIRKGQLFTSEYNKLLTNDYLATITDPNIKREYEKLVNAISKARSAAVNGGHPVGKLTGIVGEYSFIDERSIINCAEVWAAREHILAGGKFEELFFSTRRFSSGGDLGALFPPCENCQHTFIDILSQLEK